MAKSKEKDQLIDQLLKKVEEKKKQIEKIKNPDFKTNLLFNVEIFGNPARMNLNTVSEEVLFSFLAYVNMLIEQSKKIESSFQLTDITFPRLWYGYTLSDWENDIILKIKQKQSLKQTKELREIEDKLNNLMSEDKKKDIELTNLKNLLED
jgi:hypothetical protein